MSENPHAAHLAGVASILSVFAEILIKADVVSRKEICDQLYHLLSLRSQTPGASSQVDAPIMHLIHILESRENG